MTRKSMSYIQWAMIALFVFGIWLAELFGKGTDTSTARLLSGCLLALGAGAVLCVLERRKNGLPMERAELEGWRSVRAAGKRSYLRGRLIYGCGLFLGFIVIQLVRAYYKGDPFAWSVKGVGLLILLGAAVYIGGSYYASVRWWALREEVYEETLQADQETHRPHAP